MVKVFDSDPGAQEGEFDQGGGEGECVLVMVEVDSGGVLGAVSVEEHLEYGEEKCTFPIGSIFCLAAILLFCSWVKNQRLAFFHVIVNGNGRNFLRCNIYIFVESGSYFMSGTSTN